MLTQRMAKNANVMLAENIVDPEVAFLLGKDTNTYRDTATASWWWRCSGSAWALPARHR
jgi:hypothetical protein